MLKELKENVEKLGMPTINEEGITHFRQLTSYIDSSLADAFKKDGDEKVQALVIHLLNIRDYLVRVTGSNGLRQVLMTEVINTIDAIEASHKQDDAQESVQDDDVVKKNEDYLTETSLHQEKR